MNIFLAGGGTAKESEPIDTCFVASLDPKKPLIYIPNAMKSRPYQSCLEWLSESFEPLGAHAIEMWHDLQPRRPVQDIAGIYIGGGDTAKLLRDLRSSGFDRYVIEAVNRDIPVYGGSAGAIVLGEDIRTTPEASDISVSEAIGLGVVPGHLIACHFRASQEHDLRRLVSTVRLPVIAIPERAGAHLKGSILTNYGSESLLIVGHAKTRRVAPNATIDL